MSKKGFRKDTSIADFEVRVADDTHIVYQNAFDKNVDKAKAAEVFYELQNVYARLGAVLGNTKVMQDFAKCIHIYYKYFIK